jgi:hypothetical protein
LAISRQCELAGVTRSTFYVPLRIVAPDEEELILSLIDAEYPPLQPSPVLISPLPFPLM